MTEVVKENPDNETVSEDVPAEPAAAQDVEGVDNDEAVETLELYKPEGLPDHYLGGNDQETIDKLYRAVDGFRKEQSKKGYPSSAEDYDQVFDDDLKSKLLNVGEDGKDPFFEEMKSVFFEHNIHGDAFKDIASKLYEAVSGMQQEAGDVEASGDFEYQSFGGTEKAKASIDAAELWVSSLEKGEKIDPEIASEMRLLSQYGEGLKVLMKMRELMGEQPIPSSLSKEGVVSEVTEEQVQARVKDPRYWRDKDPVFVQETAAMFKKVYG